MADDINESLRQQVYAVTDGRGVDICLDPIGGDVFDGSLRALDFEALVPDPHGLLAHADRFGGYALVRPSVDPAFRAALESLIDPRLSPDDRLSGIVKAVREAMSPAEFIRLFSPTLHN